jgi:hypothetical protein
MSTTNILDLNNRIDELEKNSGGGGSADSAKRSDIATEFNTTTAYTAGCYVYHEGKLYQFNTDHAAGAWDPTDVVEANVTDQIVSNKAAIDGLTASDIAYGDDTVADALDDVKPMTATGTTLTELITAIDGLTDTQKINAKIKVGTNVLSIYYHSGTDYAYNFIQVSSNGTVVEYRLSKLSANPTMQSLITNGTTTTTSTVSVSSWELYY